MVWVSWGKALFLYFLLNVFAMTEILLLEKFRQLPESSQDAVAKFVDFLLSQAKRTENGSKAHKRGGFGSWKGIRLSPDFDAPLEDFKEYME